MFNFLNVWIAAALNFFHGIIPNYGVAIILLTLAIKLILFYPTTVNQRKVMLKQRRMQPMIDEINRKYANDPERKNQKTMEVYKKEKFNPLSGCLPMLLTLPIFFILISVMRTLGNEQIVEMFNTVANGGTYVPESFLWVRNVWQPDNFWAPVIPDESVALAIRAVANNANLAEDIITRMHETYATVMAPLQETYSVYKNGWFILPLLAGGVQYLTAKINPQQQQPAPQPGQKQGMMNSMTKMMPLLYVFFCATSNTIFTLYWVASGVFELAAQLIFRYIDKKKAAEAALAEAK